ncbi:MAG: prepilin-type N-terminal cleavage/methylation domain-containing protein [Candidatus Wallbacteria bacterium]|nr:prepilin-type N-terminal cleavage/methylation domain-containing protein [Candidatus Wallbacteria bacterium]
MDVSLHPVAPACRIWRSRLGFTLMEMAIVLAILGVLLRMATPALQRTIVRTRETVLRQDLAALREAIDGYFADHKRYPDTLTALIEKHYIRKLPVDPFTRRPDTWVTLAPEDAEGGVWDVRSGTDFVGLDGKAYNEW